MRGILTRLKALVFGRPIASDHYQRLSLRTRLALPLFGASLLSTVAYAPDAVLDAMRRGGQMAAVPWLALGVVAIMVLLGFAYRSNVRKRPDERGDYGLVRDRLGPEAGVVTGASLLVDYVFTLAVSVAAIAQFVMYVFHDAEGWQTPIAVAAIAIITLVNLRGVRDRVRVMAAVWFGFLLVVAVMFVIGTLHGPIQATGASPEVTWSATFAFAGAIASGAVMLTGIEHLASSAPAHAEPRNIRAGRTLILAVLAGAAAFLGVMLLVWKHRVSGWRSGPAILQAADRIVENPFLVWAVALFGIAILYGAASAVFRRFASLTSLLARDTYLPRQLSQANDRFVYRGGVLWVGGASAVLVLLTGARLEQLIHMYVIGAFAAIVLSQVAMVRLQSARIALELNGSQRLRMMGTRVLHAAAAVVAALVWMVVITFNFVAGAWFALVLIVVLALLMRGIHTHYGHVREELAITKDDDAGVRPSATHGVVLVAQLHRPALRAIAYAKAVRHSSLEAVAVQIEPAATRGLQRQWGELDLGVPLVILDSPYRDLVGPVLDHVRSIHRESPRDMVVVYVPEYIVGRWWERFLHNRASMRLRARLLSVPRVVVAAVPWHLSSALGAGDAAALTRELPTLEADDVR